LRSPASCNHFERPTHSRKVTADDALRELSDIVLIRRFLLGDEYAFRALYRRHTPRLRMLVWRLLAQRDADTDDVIQETWLAACRAMGRFNGDARFSTWLTTIGIRAARTRFAAVDGATSDSEDVDAMAHSAEEPASTIDLERALARLPDRQRVVVVLHDIEGFTHQEIASHLGVAAGTSKVTLMRAREALRRMLNDGVSHVG
jgi:RNA polymerase sigma factor (sigma-70 family)